MDVPAVPHFDWRTAFKAKDGLPEADTLALDEYFAPFAAIPEGTGCPCIKCGAPLGGFLGMFEWGIVHGEGRCSRCKWPARAYHFNAGPIERLELILQYHPSVVIQEVEA